MEPSDEFLSVESAGNAAGVSPRTLRYWITGGKLPATAGPKGKLVRLGDVLALAEMTGRSTPQATGARQAAGNPAMLATSAAGSAGDAANAGDDEHAALAVSPAAIAQLEAIRDQWLAPLVARIEELAHDNGRLLAERDAIATDRDRLATEVARDRGLADDLVDLLQDQLGAATAEAARLRGAQAAVVVAPVATGGPAPRWRFWGRGR